jgi:PKD repeat protein
MTVDALHPSQIELLQDRRKRAGTGPAAKVAILDTVDFTWSPSAPVLGEEVQFTDQTGGSAYNWSWTFGDGESSNEQHPIHTYNAPGTYTVTLAVTTGMFGTSFASKDLTVVEAPEGMAHFMLAVVAALPGAEDTVWRSDLWVLNPFAVPQRLWLVFAPVGGTAWFREQLVVDAGLQVTVEDVMGQIFAAAGEGKGSLHVWAPEGVFISSRTYNLGVGGTFGQSIPALGGGDLLAEGETGMLLKLKSTATARCNIGFTEFDGEEITVQVVLYGLDGSTPSLLAESSYEVDAYEHLQVNRVFSDMGLSAEYEEALATVQITGAGRAYVYASNVDERTGDAEFIPAIKR